MSPRKIPILCFGILIGVGAEIDLQRRFFAANEPAATSVAAMQVCPAAKTLVGQDDRTSAEPQDRQVIDVAGKRDLAQRLAGCHTFSGLRAHGWNFCLRPWRRARPSLVRFRIRSRSNSAMPTCTVDLGRPCG
jgi:hypothetical protein